VPAAPEPLVGAGPRVVVPCGGDLQAAVDVLRSRGFRLVVVSPADDPATALVRRDGLDLVLDRTAAVGGPIVVEVPGSVEPLDLPWLALRAYDPHGAVRVPAGRQATWVSRGGDGAWTVGRAGMRYRDLLPDRHGGRFVLSHIMIPTGGPVPDYVHHHRIRFQVIFCRAGWVEVVYEDQAEPFVLRAGDCVLQPPGIRHRVLSSSAGLEVVEVGCPAVHDTLVDDSMALPTGTVDPDRDFDGQRFVRHVAAEAPWEPSSSPSLEQRDTGIAVATAGLGSVRTLRLAPGSDGAVRGAAHRRHGGELDLSHDGELRTVFVLHGSAALTTAAGRTELSASDAVTVAAGEDAVLGVVDLGTELLEVAIPAVA
jgi:mannose-6-phosphate isomerase-like protein (cupin superfamily)